MRELSSRKCFSSSPPRGITTSARAGRGDELAQLLVVGARSPAPRRPAGRPRRSPSRTRSISARLVWAAIRRTPQYAGISRLDRERSGVGRDVGPGLVDDRDHAQRDAHLLDQRGHPCARTGRAPRRSDRAARRRRARRRPARRCAPASASAGRRWRSTLARPRPPRRWRLAAAISSARSSIARAIASSAASRCRSAIAASDRAAARALAVRSGAMMLISPQGYRDARPRLPHARPSSARMSAAESPAMPTANGSLVGPGELDRVAGREAPAHVGHADRQQARALGGHRARWRRRRRCTRPRPACRSAPTACRPRAGSARR